MVATMMQFIGGPRHREFVAVDDHVNFVTEALPESQCNGAQEWTTYFRKGDQMIFGGRAFSRELSMTAAQAAMNARPKARNNLRGGTDR